MSTTGFFLNHVPEGSMVIYEFHKDRPVADFDYHQIYFGPTSVQSKLLSPEYSDYVSKAQQVREKYTDGNNRLYAEWDNPLGGELQPPAVFIDFGPWWSSPEAGQPTKDVWNKMLLETAQAAGFDFTADDIPECPEVHPFSKITFGFFPARDHSVPWFRVACARSVRECPEFAERLGFSTKWFDKFDLNKYCETCLISFNISAEGVTKPAAEMILKAQYQSKVPDEFSEFSDTYEQGRELILEHHGPSLKNLNLCHFKVTLTDESFENQEAKMYMYANVKPNHG